MLLLSGDHPTFEELLAQLACFKAGATFVQLDPAWPTPRKVAILEEAGVTAVVAVDFSLPLRCSLTAVVDQRGAVLDTSLPEMSRATFETLSERRLAEEGGGASEVSKGARRTAAGNRHRLARGAL